MILIIVNGEPKLVGRGAKFLMSLDFRWEMSEEHGSHCIGWLLNLKAAVRNSQ